MQTETVRRRDLPEYEANPSIELVVKSQKTGTRRIANKDGTRAMIVSDSGEILAPAGFYEDIEVDKTQFIKMYVNGVKAFNELSAAGTKIFQLVYKSMLNNPNSDTIDLHHKTVKTIAKPTFDRGLSELLIKEILYKSTFPNKFYLNINYLFNGNRLAFVKQYRMRDQAPDQQQELPTA